MSVGVNDFKENRTRSLAKAVTYRALILILDFTSIYLLSGELEVALGFAMVGNIYTSIAYYVHERFWDKIDWGKKRTKQNVET